MLLRILVTMILVALIAPVLVIIPMSFTSAAFFQFPPPGYSLKWYQILLERSDWMESIGHSLQIALLTAILSTVIGTMAACAVARVNFPGKKAFMSIMIAPMIVPVIIVGIALYHFFAPFKMIDTLPGVVMSHSILAIPIVFVTVTASLKGVDRNLELAAMGLGSSPIGAFFTITVPLIRPGILSGTLFAFITSFDELVVTIFLAGPSTKTLPVIMWENMRTQVDPSIAAVSTILIIGTILIFLIQEWVTAKADKIKFQQH
jgi:putative spermidine/putrescine transport system permease protein